MAIIKFEVLGSYTDRVYFSRIYAIDDADFSDDDELMDYMDELASTDAMEFEVSEWDEEGSEDIGGGFSIDEINKLWSRKNKLKR